MTTVFVCPSVHGIQRLCLILCLLLVAACAGKEGPEPAKEKEKDLSGFSGKYNAEAEKAFAEARVLWRRTIASVSAAEVCTNPEKAVTLLDKAISLEPDYAEAFLRRGLAKSELGQRDGAFEDATKAIRIRPSSEFYAYRGLISLRAGQERAAARDLEYALKEDSSQFRAHNFLGVLSLSQKDSRKACSHFKDGCSAGDCSFLEAARKEKICP